MMNNQDVIEYEKAKLQPRYTKSIIANTANYTEKPGSVLWFNPVTQTFHQGDVIQNEPEMSPDWYNWKNMPRIVNFAEHKKGLEREGKGEIAAGESDYGGFYPEFYGPIAEFIQNVKKVGYKQARELQAGVFSRADFPSLVATLVSIKTMLVSKPTHVIRDLFTTMATDKLSLKVGTFTDFDAIQEDLGEFSIPYEGGQGAYSYVTLNLTKRAWHMAFSEEFGMTDYTEPVEQQHMNALNGQMDLVENKRVYDQVLAVSGTAQGDWTAFTSNLSSRNPRPDVDALISTIDDVHKVQATTVLSSRKVANGYRQNTYINQSPSIVSNPPAIPYIGRANVSNIQMPLLEGLNWAVDSLVPTTWYAVFAPDAMIVANGPVRTATYYDTKSGVRGTIYKKWFGAKVVYSDLIARGTGVAS